MKILNPDINSGDKASLYVELCENEFENKLAYMLDGISFDENKLIMLSGPTCSGKTTTAERLKKRIVESGHKAVVLSIDDFFKGSEFSRRVDTEAPDYDSIKAIDLEYFDYFINRLLAGRSVLIPKFDFSTTSRAGYREYIPNDGDIYVIEGIQAVYPEILALIKGEYKSIFISVEDDIEYRGVRLTKDEIRLLRRVVRDYKFRNAGAEYTLYLWEGVRRNEEECIFPNSKSCDIYVNSFLPYEPFLIGRYAIPLLSEIPADSSFFAEALRLKEKISLFDSEYLREDMIPPYSVFREFIG